jgi:hypothetical protein
MGKFSWAENYLLRFVTRNSQQDKEQISKVINENFNRITEDLIDYQRI